MSHPMDTDMWRLGISASVSADLARLGLLETHYRVAIGEVTRSVLLAGGGVIYGGRLDPAGYTNFMLRELQRNVRRDRPLLACLSADSHRGTSPEEMEDFRQELGLFGRLVILDDLTSLRRYMVEHQVGRVFLGGRREGFEGRMPGLVEELLLTLQRGQPTYLAGGFGGITYDVARVLGVPNLPEWPIATEAAGLDEVRALASSGGYRGLHNGLTEEENLWLTTTHRPAEIAALVSRGLRRVLGDQWPAAPTMGRGSGRGTGVWDE